MSKTGTYVLKDGKLVKVSDRIPKIGFIGESHVENQTYGYVDYHLTGQPTVISSRRQKHRLMRDLGVSEAEPNGWEKNFRRDRIDRKRIEKQVVEEVSKHWRD